MGARELCSGVEWVGAVDWDRRLFDALVPTPEGTTYNAWLVRGRDRTALVDTVDPAFADGLLDRLRALGVRRLDYVVCNHAEQDHSGALPCVLAAYPGAQVLATPRCKAMLCDLLEIEPDRIDPVEDGASVALGGKTLHFVHFPWVHWPETMLTWDEEDRVLFSCDLFGGHMARGDLFSVDGAQALEAARRYYGEIMMCFAPAIAKGLPRIEALAPARIAPSHGPVHTDPARVLAAYREWTGERTTNLAVLVYVSMHDSTRLLVSRLAESLAVRGVQVELFNAATMDSGRLAGALVEAQTVVFASPTVLGGAHPAVAHAAFLANALRPRARFCAILGSYGWGGHMAEQLAGLMPNLKLESLGTVVVKGRPREDALSAVDGMAATIARRHGET